MIHNDLCKGCKYCLYGLKSVLFITGLCEQHCYYCPVSSERFGKDVMYINDKLVKNLEEDILEELDKCFSNGIAITGGEPLLVIDRVVKISHLLKREYGSNFHIHMYIHVSSLREENLKKLLSSEIDEIRVHAISLSQVMSKVDLLHIIKDSNIELGLEIPAIPGLESEIVNVIEYLCSNSLISFLNINELDVSSRNESEFLKRKFKFTSYGSVDGSLKAGLKIAEIVYRKYSWLKINVCSTRSKDQIQISSRLFRRNLRVSQYYDLVNDDGTLGRVIIDSKYFHPLNVENLEKGRYLKILKMSDEEVILEEY